MLNVALGRGTLELRSALLNTDYLNAQLVRGCCALLKCSLPTGEAACMRVSVSSGHLLVCMRAGAGVVTLEVTLQSCCWQR